MQTLNVYWINEWKSQSLLCISVLIYKWDITNFLQLFLVHRAVSESVTEVLPVVVFSNSLVKATPICDISVPSHILFFYLNTHLNENGLLCVALGRLLFNKCIFPIFLCDKLLWKCKMLLSLTYPETSPLVYNKRIYAKWIKVSCLMLVFILFSFVTFFWEEMRMNIWAFYRQLLSFLKLLRFFLRN